MPAALNLYTYVAVSPRPDRRLRVYSETLGEMRDLDLDSIRPGKSGHWSDYVRGVADVLNPLDTNCVVQISPSLAKCRWDRA